MSRNRRRRTRITIEIEVPEEYQDVHPDLIFEDFQQNPGAWKIALVPEKE